MNKEQIKEILRGKFDCNDDAWNDYQGYLKQYEVDKVTDQILALFPQGEGGRWVFKTDKLTPLQVKACVCQQCPFPGELETKCDWCDNPKMMEFLGLAIPAMGDYFQQHEPLTDEEHEIVNQEWEKAHAVEIALKEQMERVITDLTKILNQPTDRYIRLHDCNKYIENLKAELECE